MSEKAITGDEELEVVRDNYILPLCKMNLKEDTVWPVLELVGVVLADRKSVV